MQVILDARNRQPIKGQVKTDVTFIRIVSGLTLKVGCFLVNGNSFGSCVHQDLCVFIKRFFLFDENACSEILFNNDIPCKCPFDLPIIESIIIHKFHLHYAAGKIVYFLANGDYDVTIKGTIDTTNILCLNVKFATKPN